MASLLCTEKSFLLLCPFRPKHGAGLFGTEIHRMELPQILHIKLDNLAEFDEVACLRFQTFPAQDREKILLNQFVHLPLRNRMVKLLLVNVGMQREPPCHRLYFTVGSRRLYRLDAISVKLPS